MLSLLEGFIILSDAIIWHMALTVVGDVLRQGPKMQKRPKSPLEFFRSVCLWRIKPKIHNV